MTLSDIDTKITELTKADSTVAYPSANRLININIWNQNVVTMILQSQDSSDFDDYNYGAFQILDDDLVANQRDYGFGISDGVVEVKRVEVSYDGVNSNIACPIDSAEQSIAVADETITNIDSYYTQSTPAYEWKGNSLLLYPKPTASTGKIYVEVSRVAKDFTSSDLSTGTLTPGFDKNFHMMLAYGAAYEYFFANAMTDRQEEAKQKLADYEFRLRRQYGRKNAEFPLRFDADIISEDYL